MDRRFVASIDDFSGPPADFQWPYKGFGGLHGGEPEDC
jgi:hypothetical protein